MVIQLSPELEASIQRRVSGGQYSDAAEVIEAAMELLDEADKKNELFWVEVERGVRSAESGELIEYTSELMEEIILEAQENARLGLPVSDVVRP